jgi:glycosyltransferase involved in cell wall biosynthesis
MKIVIATPAFPPEIRDDAMHLFDLAERLAKEHVVHVVTYGSTYLPVEGVSVSCVDRATPLLKRIRAFTKTLKEACKDADVLYLYGTGLIGLSALHARRKGSPRLVIHVPHDGVWEYASRYFNEPPSELIEDLYADISVRALLLGYAQRYLLRRADTIVTETQRHARLLERRYGIQSGVCTVIPTRAQNPIVLPFTPERRAHKLLLIIPSDESRILAGELHALEMLQQQYPDTELVLLRSTCSNFSTEEAGKKNIRCLGATTRAERWYEARTADALVLLDHGFANQRTLVDQLAMEVPIVASETSLCAELFGLNVVHAYEPEKPDSLTDVLAGLFDDPERGTRSVRAGSTLRAEQHSAERHTQELLNVFQKEV